MRFKKKRRKGKAQKVKSHCTRWKQKELMELMLGISLNLLPLIDSFLKIKIKV